MNNDAIADLKQFIEATMSQQLAVQKTEIVSEIRGETGERFDAMNKRFDENDEKLDEILNVVGGEMNTHSVQLADHEMRITRLQKKAV